MDLKLCRVCYEYSGNFYIFDTDSNGILLSSKIMYCCANISIKENDGLPSYICNNCKEDLEKAYSFVTKCEATYRMLHSQTSDSNLDKNYEHITKIEIKSEENDIELDLCDNKSFDYNSPDEIEIPLSNLDTRNSIPKSTKIKSSTKITQQTKKKSSKKGPTKCSVCDRNCLNPSTLIIHMRSHTNEKPFQCEFCNKRYKDPNTLKRHSERNHLKVRERRFICENCGKGFYSATEIITHFRTHTGETPYGCSECPSSFTQLSSLLRHKKKHRGEKSEVCNVCSKGFTTKDELKRHLQVHTNSKDFSCTYCDHVFKYKHNLSKHIKLHSEPNSFICNHCGNSFNTKGNLKIHIKKVHSDKSGFCKTCSKMVSNIEVHMWKHTGERPLKCELCTKSFYEPRALTHHINFSHNHIDKYKCIINNCPQSFPSKTMLDFHIAKFHEGRFVFTCEKCPRGFYRKSDLARHMTGTHKEKLLQ